MNKSAVFRGMLVQAGITITPEPEHPYVRARREQEQRQKQAPTVDREKISAALRAGGIAGDRLEWMVASCPSLEHAENYVASLPPAPKTEEEPMRPIEGETYEDDRNRWFLVVEVNETEPNGREVIGKIMADSGAGIGRDYACSIAVFREIWRAR